MRSVPSLDDFKSRDEWETHIWKKIVKNLSAAESAAVIEKSLNMLLTAYEKTQIIKRASAISLLQQGKTYGEIGDLLWLSPQTISAIRKSMRVQNGYVSRYTRTKAKISQPSPRAKEEARTLLLAASIEAFFTLPAPPMTHPRLPEILKGSTFPKKRKRF